MANYYPLTFYNSREVNKELDKKIALAIKKRCKEDEGKWSCKFDNMTTHFYFKNGHVCQHFARIMSDRYITKAHVYKEGKLKHEYKVLIKP